MRRWDATEHNSSREQCHQCKLRRKALGCLILHFCSWLQYSSLQWRIKTSSNCRYSVVNIARVSKEPHCNQYELVWPVKKGVLISPRQRPESGPLRNLKAVLIRYKPEKCWSHPPQTDARWADLSLESQVCEITESLPYGKNEKASARAGLCQVVFQCGYSQASFSSTGVHSRLFRELR